MPDEFVLRNVANQDVWVSEAEGLEVQEGIFVRIRIANIQLQPEKLVHPARMHKQAALRECKAACCFVCVCAAASACHAVRPATAVCSFAFLQEFAFAHVSATGKAAAACLMHPVSSVMMCRAVSQP